MRCQPSRADLGGTFPPLGLVTEASAPVQCNHYVKLSSAIGQRVVGAGRVYQVMEGGFRCFQKRFNQRHGLQIPEASTWTSEDFRLVGFGRRREGFDASGTGLGCVGGRDCRTGRW